MIPEQGRTPLFPSGASGDDRGRPPVQGHSAGTAGALPDGPERRGDPMTGTQRAQSTEQRTQGRTVGR